jgi:hypothetical protein
MFLLGYWINFFTICRPFWARILHRRGDECGDIITEVNAVGLINIVLDLFTLILPIPTLSRLQMPRLKRIGIFVLFGIGFV